CAVATCRNSHRRTRGRRIRYHRFPQIPEVRSRWVQACGRQPLSNGDIPFNIQTARICSLHFTNDSYEKDMEHLVLGLPVRSRLRRGAVPTIGVPVAVQPVTKMLVEDAKRSLLKAAHAKQHLINKQNKQAAANSKLAAAAAAAENHNGVPGNRIISKKVRGGHHGGNNPVGVGSGGGGGAYQNYEECKLSGIDILLALGLTPASHLNKMHAMDNSSGVSVGNGKKIDGETIKRDDDESRKSPKVPQSQQNGAALPEETASADRNLARCGGPASPIKRDKKEPLDSLHNDDNDDQRDDEHHSQSRSSKLLSEQTNRQNRTSNQQLRSSTGKLSQQIDEELPIRETRKRRLVPDPMAPLGILSSNGSPSQPKRLRLDQREQFISSLVGPSDKLNAEQLAMRSDQLRAEVQELDELARAKEMEWNEILSMRKLKEEAYLRLERRRQVMGFMESNGPHSGGAGSEHQMLLPPASLALSHLNYDRDHSLQLIQPKEERTDGDSSATTRRDLRNSKNQPLSPYQIQQQLLAATRYQQLENGPRLTQQLQGQGSHPESPDHRPIGEGRQGPIVDVRSIIADYRLRHPDTLPKRRGRRMRNSVNVGLGAGGAMVETGNTDSRPSSTDSCKSNSTLNDPNNPMSFKDVLVQFAKLSQQQGEPIKTPQNYPDVTLHPVTAAQTTPSPAPPTTGSLLHGILTKSQSPRPTTFSPTLARLLTAPERERNASTLSAGSHHSASQNLLQTYQTTNPVSITDFLSSSKARTEITITPVVSNPIQSLSNNLIQIDDAEEDNSIIEERDSTTSIGTRDNRDERDSQPRCQGCHERLAQFVCAGCGNQWYCSRECQVAAWDDHSEVCSG
ncbi:hypothetical protein QAD02_015357, partial [Eretmocerus hayati]